MPGKIPPEHHKYMRGECYDFALALLLYIPDGRLVAVDPKGRLGMEHVGVFDGTYYYDVRGRMTEKEFRKGLSAPGGRIEEVSVDDVSLHCGFPRGMGPPFKGMNLPRKLAQHVAERALSEAPALDVPVEDEIARARSKHNLGESQGRYVFLSNCVNWPEDHVDALIQMQDDAEQISRRKFVSMVNKDDLRQLETELGYDRNLKMVNDYHVSYYKSKLYHFPCVYFDHSRIEFVFVEPSARHRVFDDKNRIDLIMKQSEIDESRPTFYRYPLTETIRRPIAGTLTREFEAVNEQDELIGYARVEDGVITAMSYESDDQTYRTQVLSTLLSWTTKAADHATANLSIQITGNLQELKGLFERFGFRHVGDHVMRRTAGAIRPASVDAPQGMVNRLTESDLWDEPFIEAHRVGDRVEIEMMFIPTNQRGKGVGAQYYREWENNLPNDVNYVQLFAADTGSGRSNWFWEAMGFGYKYDIDPDSGITDDDIMSWMIKGVNGTPTPEPMMLDEDDF